MLRRKPSQARRPGKWPGCVLCRIFHILADEPATPEGDPCVVIPGHIGKPPHLRPVPADAAGPARHLGQSRRPIFLGGIEYTWPISPPASNMTSRSPSTTPRATSRPTAPRSRSAGSSSAPAPDPPPRGHARRRRAGLAGNGDRRHDMAHARCRAIIASRSSCPIPTTATLPTTWLNNTQVYAAYLPVDRPIRIFNRRPVPVARR